MAEEDLGRISGLDTDQIARYEFGEDMTPISHLSVLAQAVGQDLRHFLDSGNRRRDQIRPEVGGPRVAPADTELLRFAADDKNRAFIRLAMAFRQIDREDLHRIAEALYNVINDKRGTNGRAQTPA